MKNLKNYTRGDMISINDNILTILPMCKRPFRENGLLQIEQIEECFNFAKKIANPNDFGEHNPNSHGGEHERDADEIFQNAFQGKVAEFAFYNLFKNRVQMNPPDLNRWEKGVWEDADFELHHEGTHYLISLKSTKSIGNLLLLEKHRYNKQGEYIEGTQKDSPVKHDYIFLARVKGIDSKFSNSYNEKKLHTIKAEISGYISNSTFKKNIAKNKYIKKGTLIGNKPMMVDNYWFCITEISDRRINI